MKEALADRTPTAERVFKNGRKARRERLDLGDCPYCEKLGSMLAVAWKAGWQEEDQQIRLSGSLRLASLRRKR